MFQGTSLGYYWTEEHYILHPELLCWTELALVLWFQTTYEFISFSLLQLLFVVMFEQTENDRSIWFLQQVLAFNFCAPETKFKCVDNFMTGHSSLFSLVSPVVNFIPSSSNNCLLCQEDLPCCLLDLWRCLTYVKQSELWGYYLFNCIHRFFNMDLSKMCT